MHRSKDVIVRQVLYGGLLLAAFCTSGPRAGGSTVLRGDTALASIQDLRIAPLPVPAAQPAPRAPVRPAN